MKTRETRYAGKDKTLSAGICLYLGGILYKHVVTTKQKPRAETQNINYDDWEKHHKKTPNYNGKQKHKGKQWK